MRFERFSNLDSVPGLRHLITTRQGGASTGAYASLNLGYHVGDDPTLVTRNRKRLADCAGYEPGALVTARQVHGTTITLAGSQDRGRGALSYDTALPATDALIVRERELPAAVLVADCAPILLVDPVRRALALVHAGWRGALGRIVSRTVAAMTEQVGADPGDLLAGIGPTLCPSCFEVSEDVAAIARDAFGPIGVEHANERSFLDMRAVLRSDLMDAGVPERHIVFHPMCTRCQPAVFFSHRGQAGVAGRFALVAWWQ